MLIDGGTLHINASGDGIECEKGCIEINGGEITINSTDDGIVASCEDNDYTISPFIKINGGNLTITTSGQKGMAIKSESNTTINGGDLRLAVSGEASKGIKSGGHVVITGGTLDITTTGNAFYESNDISSAAGIKCDGSFKITNPGTTLTITSSGSAGKGINCDGTLTIENCTVNVTTTGKPYIYGRLDASAKGIKSDGNLTIRGSNVTVKTTGGENSEGIESKATLTIESGTIEVIAYDDCINAANAIVINGGMTYCYSSNNDGIDSNGTGRFRDCLRHNHAGRRIRLRPEHFYNHRGNHHRNRREYQYPNHKDLHPTLSRLRDLRNRRTNYKHPISRWNEYINLPITEIIHTINLPIQ